MAQTVSNMPSINDVLAPRPGPVAQVKQTLDDLCGMVTGVWNRGGREVRAAFRDGDDFLGKAASAGVQRPLDVVKEVERRKGDLATAREHFLKIKETLDSSDQPHGQIAKKLEARMNCVTTVGSLLESAGECARSGNAHGAVTKFMQAQEKVRDCIFRSGR